MKLIQKELLIKLLTKLILKNHCQVSIAYSENGKLFGQKKRAALTASSNKEEISELKFTAGYIPEARVASLLMNFYLEDIIKFSYEKKYFVIKEFKEKGNGFFKISE
ncbi:hypothetical protein K8R66_02005 [bacterium]|nr:hypothetical protein [bacterium]